VKFIVAIFLLIATACSTRGADYFGITDPYMAEYSGFWSGENGTKGRLTAQLRPLSNNQYDGFVLFTRVKTPVAVFKLNPAPAENGVLRFTAASVSYAGADLVGDNEATCELRDGQITGAFKGELGEGTFSASKSERKAPTLGAKAPKHAIVLTENDSTNE